MVHQHRDRSIHYLFVVLITFHSIFVFVSGSELINKAKNGTIPQQVADIYNKIGSQRKFCFDTDMFLTIGNDPGYTIGVKQIMIGFMLLILTVEMTMGCVRQLEKLFYDLIHFN